MTSPASSTHRVSSEAAKATKKALEPPPRHEGMPTYLIQKLAGFLSRGGTGNFIINIRDGKVMGGKLEEHIKQP